MVSAELKPLGEDRFVGPAQTEKPHQVFGGHFIGQALLAALRTTENNQAVHSLHSYFLKPGDSSVEILYQVERVREGRSSSTRQVIATQNGHEVFRLMASFSIERTGPQPLYDRMPAVPHYNDLSPYVFDGDWAWASGLECRYVNVPGNRSAEERSVCVWLRINSELEKQLDNPSVVLAYLSDATVGDGVFLRKGWDFENPAQRYLSLDHSIWFHAMAPVGEWLLFEQTADWVGEGRGLARSRVFSEKGELLASCAQEALAYAKN